MAFHRYIKERIREPVGYLSGIFAILAGAAAAGPDTWVEWLTLGATMIGPLSARLLITITALAAVMIFVWPVLRRPR